MNRLITKNYNSYFYERVGGYILYRYPKLYPKKKRGSDNSLIISDLGRIQTCNLLSRNQVHYSVMLRGQNVDLQ